MAASPASALELFWIPLGAGGHFVRFNGRVYEAITATLARREHRDLFHAALIAVVDGHRYAIELTPTPKGDPAARGVVAAGPVGARWAGRSRLFRYEVRCGRDGTIPDIDWAVGGPVVLGNPTVACRVLELAPQVPRLVWGRDEERTGDMWNSNSVVSWLLEAAGVDAEFLFPPAGGRAPGWHAGVEVARRAGGEPVMARQASLACRRRRTRTRAAPSAALKETHEPHSADRRQLEDAQDDRGRRGLRRGLPADGAGP